MLLQMNDMPGGGGTTLSLSLLVALLHFKVTKLAGGPASAGDISLRHSTYI